MATAAAIKGPKEFIFLWEGKDRAGKIIRGELRAVSETAVNATLRRRGILVQKVRKQKIRGGGRVSEKDLALFTRQLATMMKAGVPLLQAFDIVGKGASNPAAARSEEHTLNSSHRCISYAVFCLKKKKNTKQQNNR